MTTYFIRDLEQLSGIKAHTIRIWEQRYNLFSPNRSDTNIRNYTVEDLKLLLNVALLNEHGHKISKIASLSETEILQKVTEIADAQISFPDQIQALTTSMLDFDEERFEHLLDVNVIKFGFEATMINIIYPFLIKTGSLWITGSIGTGHEHFMSSLIRQKLIVAIDSLPKTLRPDYKKFVLFLPEGEYHELSLLFGYFLIKSRQHKVYYLGQSLPQADLVNVGAIQDFGYIFTAITSSPGPDAIQKYVNWLGNEFQEYKIQITGFQTIYNPLILPENISIMYKIEDLFEIIK